MYYLLALFLPAFVWSSRVLERVESPESEWTELERSNPDQEITLGFALKNEKISELHDLLMTISTPGSPEYGNFRTASELEQMIAPKEEALEAVYAWLEAAGYSEGSITKLTPTGDLLTVRMTIGEAEKLLECEYYDYISSVDESVQVSRVKMGTDYHVHDTVSEHLYFVSPTHRFPFLEVGNVKSESDEVDLTIVTPQTLRMMYKCDSAFGMAENNSQAVASFSFHQYTVSDVKDLWQTYNVTETTITDVPTNQGSGFSPIAETDVQYLTSVGQGIPTQHWYSHSNFADFPEVFLSWSTSVLNAAKQGTAPSLFTMGYGQKVQNLGAGFVTRMDTQFMSMGAAGITLFSYSGETGAGGGCSYPPFFQYYPASSPYVTSVGGTVGGDPSATPPGESAWIFGGGGFSNYSFRQSWQSSFVQHYLDHYSETPPSCFNATGRGYPDISAQATLYRVFLDGFQVIATGTNAASATSAGIFALLNDLRISNGMSSLGFANPLIYQAAEDDASSFNDIVDGLNQGCVNSALGFYASPKWDPVTGLGSPNYSVLKKYVLKTGEPTKKFH